MSNNPIEPSKQSNKSFAQQIADSNKEIRAELIRICERNKVTLSVNGSFLTEAEELIAKEQLAAQTNAVAWTVGVVDQMHLGVSHHNDGDIDRTYKGIKNTIRSRYEHEMGEDPAPNYPVIAALKAKEDNFPEDPETIYQLKGKGRVTKEEFEEAHKRPCSEVHPDLDTNHGGH